MVSPLASVHPDAKIAGNVRIDAFAVVEHDTVLGDGTWIMSGGHVLAGSRLGKNCRIHQGAVVGGMPQDLKFSGEHSEVYLGDGCVVRECATINRGTKAYGKTTLGKECLVMAYAHVAHDCIIGDHGILVNNVALAGHVEIGDWSILGGLSAVHQFVKIGAHVMVGGGSLVRKDIPPYITVA
ncbi:MAG: acyl-ACP--UDP-N-acetylglucosamine O-acyltransferase, partial [Schleiferiaceae bacterium]